MTHFDDVAASSYIIARRPMRMAFHYAYYFLENEDLRFRLEEFFDEWGKLIRDHTKERLALRKVERKPVTQTYSQEQRNRDCELLRSRAFRRLDADEVNNLQTLLEKYAPDSETMTCIKQGCVMYAGSFVTRLAVAYGTYKAVRYGLEKGINWWDGDTKERVEYKKLISDPKIVSYLVLLLLTFS